MTIKRLLVLSALPLLVGSFGFTVLGKAIANQSTLVTQNSSPSNQQPAAGKEHSGPGFAKISGLTDDQKAQIKQIWQSSHQQMDAIFTSEQKARMQAIREDAKSKMAAVLTDQQRQQLQQTSSADGRQKGPGFAKISGLTDDQKAQIKQIWQSSRQQMDAIATSEQKARMQAIREDAKSKMAAVLTDQQRQQLEELRQQKPQRLQQQ